MKDLTIKLRLDPKTFQAELVNVKKDLNGIPEEKTTKLEMQNGNALQSIAQVGMALTGVVSAIQLVSRAWNSTISNWVNLAQIQERSEIKVANAIKTTGATAGFTAKELNKVASELQTMTNFGDEEILETVTAQLLTFKSIAGDTFLEAQKAVLDLSAFMNQDLRNSSIMLGKALNDPVLGLTAMRRVGIQFTDDQETQIKNFVEINDLASAQGIILKELSSQFGGASQAIVDPLIQVKNAMGDVNERFGQIILDKMREFSKFMLETVLPAINDMIDFFEKWSIMIVTTVSSALAIYITKLIIATSWTGFLTGATAILNKVLIASPYAVLAVSLGFLVQQIMNAKSMFESWTSVLILIGAGLLKITLMIGNFSLAIIKSISYIIEFALNPFSEGIKAVTESLMLLFKGDFKGAGARITSGLKQGILNNIDSLNNELKNSWDKILNDPTYDKIGEQLYNKIHQDRKPVTVDVETQNKSSDDKSLNILTDSEQKKLEELRKSFLDKKALLELEYNENVKFINKTVKDEADKQALLKQLNQKHSNDLAEIKKSEFEANIKHFEDLKNLGIISYDELLTEVESYCDFVKNHYGEDSKEYIAVLKLKKNTTKAHNDEIKKDYSEMMTFMIENMKGWISEFNDELGALQYSLKASFDIVANNLSNVLSQLIMEGKSFSKIMSQAFKNMATQAINEINRIIIKMLILKALGFITGNPIGWGGALKSVLGVKAATGGYISGPGTATSDSIPAMLSNGEYVINAQKTSIFKPLLDLINYAPLSQLQKSLNTLLMPAFNIPSIPRMAYASGGYVTSNNMFDTRNLEVKLDKMVDRLERIERKEYNVTVQTKFKGVDFVREIKKAQAQYNEVIR